MMPSKEETLGECASCGKKGTKYGWEVISGMFHAIAVIMRNTVYVNHII